MKPPGPARRSLLRLPVLPDELKARAAEGLFRDFDPVLRDYPERELAENPRRESPGRRHPQPFTAF